MDEKNGSELLVPIDVSKYFHKAMILGPRGETLEEPFEVDIYRDGLDKLLRKMQEAKNKSGAKRVIFALEPTSYYHQVLLEQLTKMGHEVQRINPSVSSQIRSLDFRHVKTDAIDVRSLGKGLRDGRGNLWQPLGRDQARLRALTRQRMRRGKMVKWLKTQMHKEVDTLWPGLVNKYEGEKGLVHNLWESQMGWALLQICPNPQRIAKMEAKGLIALFRRRGVKGIGPQRAARIIAHARKVIPRAVHIPETVYTLKSDMRLLHHLQTICADLEKHTLRLIPEEARYLLSVKGISPFFAAAFLAEVGDIRRFATAKKLIKYTGLGISVKESGMKKKHHGHVTKEGNRYLRYVVMTMARNVARCHPEFRAYFEKRKGQGRVYYDAISCVAGKMLKAFHALLTRKEVFDTSKFRG